MVEYYFLTFEKEIFNVLMCVDVIVEIVLKSVVWDQA